MCRAQETELWVSKGFYTTGLLDADRDRGRSAEAGQGAWRKQESFTLIFSPGVAHPVFRDNQPRGLPLTRGTALFTLDGKVILSKISSWMEQKAFGFTQSCCLLLEFGYYQENKIRKERRFNTRIKKPGGGRVLAWLRREAKAISD